MIKDNIVGVSSTWNVPLVRYMTIALAVLNHVLTEMPVAGAASARGACMLPPWIRWSSMYWVKYKRRVAFFWNSAGTVSVAKVNTFLDRLEYKTVLKIKINVEIFENSMKKLHKVATELLRCPLE